MILTEQIKTILRAVADGKQLQNKPVHGEPHDISTDNALKYIANGYGGGISVKPEIRSINGKVFAAPVGEDEEKVQWRFAPAHAARLMDYFWTDAKDRDAAYTAIFDALEGRTK